MVDSIPHAIVFGMFHMVCNGIPHDNVVCGMFFTMQVLLLSKPHKKNLFWIFKCQVINAAPMEFVNKIGTHSLHGFSGYIKIKILESYQEVCTVPNCYICSRC